MHIIPWGLHAVISHKMNVASACDTSVWPPKCRDFAKYVECVADADCARVVAVTSPERAAAAHEERPGFFDEIHNVL